MSALVAAALALGGYLAVSVPAAALLGSLLRGCDPDLNDIWLDDDEVLDLP